MMVWHRRRVASNVTSARPRVGQNNAPSCSPTPKAARCWAAPRQLPTSAGTTTPAFPATALGPRFFTLLKRGVVGSLSPHSKEHLDRAALAGSGTRLKRLRRPMPHCARAHRPNPIYIVKQTRPHKVREAMQRRNIFYPVQPRS
jgi:hypothetical protein